MVRVAAALTSALLIAHLSQAHSSRLGDSKSTKLRGAGATDPEVIAQHEEMRQREAEVARLAEELREERLSREHAMTDNDSDRQKPLVTQTNDKPIGNHKHDAYSNGPNPSGTKPANMPQESNQPVVPDQASMRAPQASRNAGQDTSKDQSKKQRPLVSPAVPMSEHFKQWQGDGQSQGESNVHRPMDDTTGQQWQESGQSQHASNAHSSMDDIARQDRQGNGQSQHRHHRHAHNKAKVHHSVGGTTGDASRTPSREINGPEPAASTLSSPMAGEAGVDADEDTDWDADDDSDWDVDGDVDDDAPDPDDTLGVEDSPPDADDDEDTLGVESAEATAEAKSGNNICVDGRLLPNMYLLGAQKAGTTSLAGDLVAAGVWNTKLDDEFGARKLGDNVKDIVSAAGSIAGDLINAGILHAKDLSNGTKQALAEDLVRQGVIGAAAGKHLDNSTKASLADDLVRNGLLDNVTYEGLDQQTKALVDRDIVRACLLNRTIASHLSTKTRESLANDLDRLKMLDNDTTKAVLKGNGKPRLEDGQPRIERLEFFLRNGLAHDDTPDIAVIAKQLKTETKAMLVGDLSKAGFLATDIAEHLDSTTKQSLGGEILSRHGLDNINVHHLKGSTKESIAENLVNAGIMQTEPADTLNSSTKERIAWDIAAKSDNATAAELKTTKELSFTNTKESHYFEHVVVNARYPEDGDGHMLIDWKAARKFWKGEWLDRLVDCPEKDTPVYADFTPANMRMIPLPEGTKPTGRQWGSVGGSLFFKRQDGTSQLPQDLVMDLPLMMSEFYGHEKDKITFIVMVREPLARMQSAFYHSRESAENGPCTECKGDSFNIALKETLSDATNPVSDSMFPKFRDWLWTSMYGRQLQYWLKTFKPSQFYIVPMNVYSSGDNVQICHDLSKQVKVEINCKPFENAVPEQLNTHEHPQLDEDASLELRGQFADFISKENDLFVDVLAEANAQGMQLASFDGTTGDKESIRSWLFQYW